jgi:hypothetical protein
MILPDDRLWTFGLGVGGRLGHGDCTDKLVPTLVLIERCGGAMIVMVAAGAWHSMTATADGDAVAGSWADLTGVLSRQIRAYEDQYSPSLTCMRKEAFDGARVLMVTYLRRSHHSGCDGGGRPLVVRQRRIWCPWAQRQH